MAQQQPIGYVACFCEHLRDGREEGAKVVPTLKDALEIFERIRNRGVAGSNYTFRLFELGREIPLEEQVIETPQPTVKSSRFVVPEQAG